MLYNCLGATLHIHLWPYGQLRSAFDWYSCSRSIGSLFYRSLVIIGLGIGTHDEVVALSLVCSLVASTFIPTSCVSLAPCCIAWELQHISCFRPRAEHICSPLYIASITVWRLDIVLDFLSILVHCPVLCSRIVCASRLCHCKGTTGAGDLKTNRIQLCWSTADVERKST